MENTLETDYLILGGGTAGCVLAARLTEDPSVNVVVVEEGGAPNDPRFKVPAGVSAVLGRDKFDWRYEIKPRESINHRKLDGAAGRVLGGGSSINGMVYIRGNAADYDSWELQNGGTAVKPTGWAYRDLEPYFKRAENFVDRKAEHLGNNGPLTVSTTRDPNPVAEQLINAGYDMGYPSADFNSGQLLGFGPAEGSVNKGSRASTYEAYLKPVIKRKNLTVLTKATVSRLVIQSGVVLGAEIEYRGRQLSVSAAQETLLCAGAIGSPAVLQRSGIGAIDELANLGIQPKHELSGVGKNLQEHVGCGISKYVNVTTINSQMNAASGLKHLLQYLFKRTGMLASPVVQTMAYIKTLPDLAQPDVQLALVPFAYIVQPESTNALTAFTPKQNGVMLSGFIANPKSRGKVALNKHDISEKPIIDYDFFQQGEDLETLVRSCKFIESVFQQPAMAQFVTGECSVQSPINSDKDWKDYIRAGAIPCYHFSGTCKMGVDKMAVVDPELKIHGLSRLRVVDASIMPTVTSGNTYAPVVAIAEKAAEMIKETRLAKQ